MAASKKIDELYDLIKGIETAMFTTRRPTGQLVSRPMATQDRIEGADLWFVTNSDTHKLDELALDPHVNFAYYNNASLNAAMDKAASLSGAARAKAYAALDLNIMKNHAPWAPYSVLSDVFFTSKRVSNWVYQPYFGEPAFNAQFQRMPEP